MTFLEDDELAFHELTERMRLHFAVQDGDLKEAKELVERGFDVNAFDEFTSTPLHCAVEGGHIEVARYLLSVGADVNSHLEEKAGDTPLGEVAGNCSYAMAELLIKGGGNPTITGWMGISALDRASKRKKKEGVRVYELLLETAKKKFHWGE
jgi:ankyrin repeat protein